MTMNDSIGLFFDIIFLIKNLILRYIDGNQWEATRSLTAKIIHSPFFPAMKEYREFSSISARMASVFLILLICNRFVQIFYIHTQSHEQTDLFCNQIPADTIDSQCNDLINGNISTLDIRKPLPNKIPLLIHQAYSHVDIPKPFSDLQDSWKHHHFEWEFVLWTEKNLDNLVRFEYPWAYNMYSSLLSFEERVDVAKYLILLTYGGVFADISLMCLRNGIRLHKMGGLIIPLVNLTSQTRPYQVSNAWMAAEPAHPFLRFMVENLVEDYDNEVPSFGKSDALYTSIRDFEVQRLPSDPPIHFLEQGYVVIPDSKSELYPRECRDSSQKFNMDDCLDFLITPDAFAISYRTTYDLKN